MQLQEGVSLQLQRLLQPLLNFALELTMILQPTNVSSTPMLHCVQQEPSPPLYSWLHSHLLLTSCSVSVILFSIIFLTISYASCISYLVLSEEYVFSLWTDILKRNVPGSLLYLTPTSPLNTHLIPLSITHTHIIPSYDLDLA